MKNLKQITVVFLLTLCMVMLAAVPSMAADNSNTMTFTMTPTYGQTEARSILSMVNEFRTGDDAWYWNSNDSTKTTLSDLSELTYDYELEEIAMQRAAEIAVRFAHERPDDSDTWSAYGGYSYSAAGENIAAGYATAKAAFVGWQETDESYSGQGHRRNMLSANYTSIGIAHVKYNGVHYWVQEFASPASGASETTAVDGEKNVSITINNNYVSNKTVTLLDDITLEYGSSSTIPDAEMSFTCTSEDTWPSNATIIGTETPSCIIADTDISSYSDGKITGNKAGTTTAIVSAFGEEKTINITVNPADIKNGMVSLQEGSYIYTGEPITPEVSSVVVNDEILTVGTDYTVSYADNTNAGIASVIITGRGNYTGELTENFTIEPKEVTGVVIEEIAAQTFTAGGCEPTVVLSDLSYNERTDYEVTYKDNNKVGTATAIVTFVGNYTGTVSGTFEITKGQLDEPAITVALDKAYTGDGTAPQLTIKENGIVLKENEDYTISYEEDVAGSTVTVKITGIGNYTGTLTKKFAITKKEEVKVNKITLSGISGQIAAGKTVKLTASITPAKATNKKLKWTSSNTKVATVTQSGVVKMLKNGKGKSVIITATATDGSGVKATYKIKSMKGIVKKVTVKGKKTVAAGKSLKLKATVKATKGANKKLVWMSGNTKYATITSSGKVKTRKAGKGKTVKITVMATDGSGKKATIKIKIK